MDPARPGVAVAMSCALQAIGGGLGWSLLPPLMPQIARDLGISHAMGGLVWGAAPLGIALAAPVGGALVDRHGARRVAGLAMFAGALACAARALATGPWTLALAMLVFGFHVGFVAPSIPKTLAGHVPVSRLGRANGTALLSYTLGTAVTVLTARTVIAPALGGWRPTMLAAAFAMALAGAAWLALVRDRTTPSRHASVRDVLALARNGQLLRVAAMQFLVFGGYLALLGLLPRALSERGMAPGRVGAAVAAWLCAAAVANFVGPLVSDTLGRRRPVVIAGACVAGAALSAVALIPAASGGGAVLWLALAAVGGGAFAPLLLALPLEIEGVGVARAGGALGLLMLVGQAGGFLLPIAVGAAAQRGGFAAALGVLAVAHVACLVPALGLRETGAARARGAAAPAGRASGEPAVESRPARAA